MTLYLNILKWGYSRGADPDLEPGGGGRGMGCSLGVGVKSCREWEGLQPEGGGGVKSCRESEGLPLHSETFCNSQEKKYRTTREKIEERKSV